MTREEGGRRTGCCFVCFLEDPTAPSFHGSRTGNLLWLHESLLWQCSLPQHPHASTLPSTPALGEQVLRIFYTLSTEFGSRDSTHALARRGCDVDYLCAHRRGRREGGRGLSPAWVTEHLPAMNRRSPRGWGVHKRFKIRVYLVLSESQTPS